MSRALGQAVFKVPMLLGAIAEADPFAGMFVMSVQTDNTGTSGTDQFTIPTDGGGYNYSTKMQLVGGGTITETSGNTGDVTLTGADGPGLYRVGVIGDFPSISFANGGDKLKVLSVENWGNVDIQTLFRSFWGCKNLSSIAGDGDIKDAARLDFAFYDTGLTSFPFSDLFPEGVCNAHNLQYSWAQTDLSIVPNLSFPQATNAFRMFWLCDNLEALGDLNFSSATNASQLLSGCSSLNSVGNIDLRAMTNGSDFLANVTLPTQEYSDLLIHLASLPVQNGATFSGGNSQYNSAGETARNSLTGTYGWTITDEGLAS